MSVITIRRLICLTKSMVVFILSMDVYLEGVDGSPAEVQQHLEMGKKLLAAGQLADALSHYHAAVDGDPNNYMTYFRRATVFLALGKSKSALPDLDQVIQLKPDFTAARSQRGNVLMKQGNLDKAKEDFAVVLSKDPTNEEANSNIHKIHPLQSSIQDAKHFYQMREFQASIDLLTQAIEVCPWDVELREIRAECYMAQGDYFKAVGDIRSTTKLRSDNTPAFLKLSLLYYDMGDAENSLINIRECLKLDPDHKECYPHYKKVKKLVKQLQSIQDMRNEKQYEDCIAKAHQILKTEPTVTLYIMKAKSFLCHCHSRTGNINDAFDICNEILNLEPENIEAVMDRAETYLLNEQFDQAVSDYQFAVNIDGDNRQAREGLEKAQKLLKQSQKRDYYRILGIKRTARKKEIMKAYKKMAKKWHPDRYKGEDKAKAEKMFVDIAAAKEVLTNPEKRQQFDNGEDPLDPEQQQHGGGHHWHQGGFNPFGSGGGGGFNFKFHFN
ncbi:dnaJ homolog subfamily C member 3-like [Pecten maximus]|uniref:dnaJ homolog subfamily C member 3-like n=1 Tax=Pecten maximus TaxID=6579 RepID=UPI0014585628|nr:dnaJ homolog subfamily C member 3-like [Pecten maximus]